LFSPSTAPLDGQNHDQSVENSGADLALVWMKQTGEKDISPAKPHEAKEQWWEVKN
jgi:hypothetical protein